MEKRFPTINFIVINIDKYYYEQTPPYEYLHDLEKDPSQLVNLVDDSEYNQVLKDMRLQALATEKQIKN